MDDSDLRARQPCTAAAGPKRCYRIDEEPAYLKPSYRRFALVADRRQLDCVDTTDGETLVVASDWLLWQACVRDGVHCVLASRGIPGWRDTRRLGADYYLRSNDWVYVAGEDATLFRGVSLGRKFVRQVSLVIADYEVKRQVLEVLTGRFRPKEYVYFDYRTDDDFLDDPERFAIVCGVAKEFGIAVIDRRDSAGRADAEFSVYSAYKPSAEPRRRSLRGRAVDVGLAAFERLVDGLSRLRRAVGSGRPRVLMLVSHMAAIPLIRKFEGRAFYPMFLAWLFPRKRDVGFVADCIARGMLVVGAPRRRLSRDERRAVDGIRARLERAWAENPASGREAMVRKHVKKHLLDAGRLYEKAADVCWAERVLARHRPDFVFTDTLQNSVMLTLVELAKLRGIPTAATWHGPYIQDVRFDIFGSDERVPPLVDTCFTWGRNHERWLDNTAATTARVRTGNPICGIYRDLPRARPDKGNVLVLQYIGPGHDFAAPTSHEYFYFVHVVRMLKDLGYANIRLKFHPGLSKVGYYERIAADFDVACELVADRPFPEMVTWADLVIGPVISGAMLEVISAGRTYYPVLLPPHSINLDYLESAPVYGDIESLRRALESGSPPDQGRLVDDFIACDDIPDPAARLWQVVGEALGRPRQPRANP